MHIKIRTKKTNVIESISVSAEYFDISSNLTTLQTAEVVRLQNGTKKKKNTSLI